MKPSLPRSFHVVVSSSAEALRLLSATGSSGECGVGGDFQSEVGVTDAGEDQVGTGVETVPTDPEDKHTECGDGQVVTDINSLKMYSKGQPLRALAMLILMFSLAGVPPMVGFFGKFYVLRAAYDAGLAWLAIAGVVASVIGAFYYLRIVFYMYFGEGGDELDKSRSPILWGFLMASAAVIAIAWFPGLNLLGVEGIAEAAANTLVN